MLRTLSLACGALFLTACFPGLEQYAECTDGACGGSASTSSASAPTTSSTTSASGTQDTSSGSGGGTSSSGTSSSTTSSSDGGSGPGGGGSGTTSTGQTSSSSGGLGGAGGGAVDPCLPPTDAPLVQAGTPVEGTSAGIPYAFCIDRAEVTHQAYRAFYDDVVANDYDLASFYDTKPACDWKEPTSDALIPQFEDLLVGDWNDTTHPDLPIVSVDYCDAAAYCAWSGKRLCGGIDGAPAPPQPKNEWYLACTHGQERIYPYNGDGEFDPDDNACNSGTPNASNCPAFDATKCATQDCGGWRGTWQADESETCAGFDPSLVNLSGNVSEWVDVCTVDDGTPLPHSSSGWYCESRGGSCPLHFYTSCAYAGSNAENDADNKASNTGFRCCWDEPEG